MGILLVFIAGLFVPLTNLFTKKGIDVRSNTKAFFVIQMIASSLFAFLLGPVRKGDFSISLPVILLGTVAGLIVSGLIYTLGRALEKGPPGFTFAILFSATVMPGLVMSLAFGTAYGFAYNKWHAIGSLLVLSGIFWGASGLQGMKHLKSWLFFVTAMFGCHLLLLVLYQWKGMLTNMPNPETISFFTMEQITSTWFTPFMYSSATVVQIVLYLRDKQGMILPKEIVYGLLGGCTNVFCTLFLLRATEVARPLETAIIFPIYSVVGIILTNFWGKKLYNEKVNWRACQLSLFGLIVGTVNWETVVAIIF